MMEQQKIEYLNAPCIDCGWLAWGHDAGKVA